MPFKMPADNCNAGNPRHKSLQGLIMLHNKGWPFQKVLGGIATEGEFRKNSQVASTPPGLVSPGNYLAAIVVKIPDHGVYLHQCYFHFSCNLYVHKLICEEHGTAFFIKNIVCHIDSSKRERTISFTANQNPESKPFPPIKANILS